MFTRTEKSDWPTWSLAARLPWTKSVRWSITPSSWMLIRKAKFRRAHLPRGNPESAITGGLVSGPRGPAAPSWPDDGGGAAIEGVTHAGVADSVNIFTALFPVSTT